MNVNYCHGHSVHNLPNTSKFKNIFAYGNIPVSRGEDHILRAITLLLTVQSVFATVIVVNNIFYFAKEDTEANQDPSLQSTCTPSLNDFLLINFRIHSFIPTNPPVYLYSSVSTTIGLLEESQINSMW